MNRRSTFMTLAAAALATTVSHAASAEGAHALEGVWLVHVTPGPGAPPNTPASDTVLIFANGLMFEDNGALGNVAGGLVGSSVQFGFYRFVRSGVFESTSWKVIAGPFGPALVKLQVSMQLVSGTEYNGQVVGSVLDWQGKEEGINFQLVTHGTLLGQGVQTA